MIHFNNLPSISLSPTVFFPPSHALDAESNREEIPPRDRFQSPWEGLYKHFVDKKIIDSEGVWVANEDPVLPSFGPAQLQRLRLLFNTPYKISLISGADSLPRQDLLSEASITLSELVKNLSYQNFDLIGSGVMWILGKEYCKKFLDHLNTPEDLIKDHLFEEMSLVPQDFDFRFFVPTANGCATHLFTHSLFQSLCPLFNKNLEAVKAGCNKKWMSHWSSREQLAMASLGFYYADSLEKAFDVDFSFVLVDSLTRQHLYKRDALSLRFDVSSRLAPQPSTSLKNIGEPFIHYLASLLDADHPTTINHMGLLLTLTATTKGRFPLKKELLEILYAKFQNDFPEKNLFVELNKSISTHCKKQPDALLAAAWNGAVLVEPAIWSTVAKSAPAAKYLGDSPLEAFYKITVANEGDIQLLQSLVCVHAYLGWGDKMTIYNKTTANFVELKWLGNKGQRPSSIFVKNDFASALQMLAENLARDPIASLSARWLANSSLNGLHLPASAIDSINELHATKAPAARRLAFALLLKWHLEHPCEKNIKDLLLLFSSLIADFSADELVHFGSLLATTLIKAPCSYPKEHMHALHGAIEALCTQPKPKRASFELLLIKANLSDFFAFIEIKKMPTITIQPEALPSSTPIKESVRRKRPAKKEQRSSPAAVQTLASLQESFKKLLLPTAEKGSTSDISALLASYSQILPTIAISQKSFKAKAACTLAEILTHLKVEDADFTEGLQLLITSLQGLENGLPENLKALLANCIKPLLPPLHAARAHDLLRNLLNECVRHALNFTSTEAIAQGILEQLAFYQSKNELELTKAENVYSIVVKWIKKEKLRQRIQPDAVMFVRLCLTAGHPQRALTWAKRAKEPDQCLNQLMGEFRRKGLWQQHGELLSCNPKLFNAQEQSLAWKAQASSRIEKSLADAAQLYIDKHALICIERENLALDEEVRTLASMLIASKSLLEKSLALTLIKTYALSDDSIWEEVLQAVNISSKEALAKAWESLKEFHLNKATGVTLRRLLSAFAGLGYTDPTLSHFASEKNFCGSAFDKKDSTNGGEIERLLYANAIACIRSGAAPEADFEELNAWREKYVPKSMTRYLQAWIQSPHTHQKIRVLQFLAKQANTRSPIVFPFSDDLLSAVFVASEHSTDDLLYEYSMRVFTDERCRESFRSIQLLPILKKMIASSLIKGGCENTKDNIPQIIAALACFEMYQKDLLKNTEDEKLFFPIIAKCLASLLYEGSKNSQRIFDSIYVFFDKKRTPPPYLRGKETLSYIQFQWDYTEMLLTYMLKADLSAQAAEIMLPYAADCLDWMISTTTPENAAVNTHKKEFSRVEKCLMALNRFAYASVFSKENFNGMRHMSNASNLFTKAIDRQLFMQNKSAEFAFHLFLGNIMNFITDSSLTERRASVLNVIGNLTCYPTPGKLSRATDILITWGLYIKEDPTQGSLCIRALLSQLPFKNMSMDEKKDKMQGLFSLIINLLDPLNYQKTSYQEASSCYKLWEKEVPQLAERFFVAIIKCFDGEKNISTNDALTLTRLARILSSSLISKKWMEMDPHAILRRHLIDITLIQWRYSKAESESQINELVDSIIAVVNTSTYPPEEKTPLQNMLISMGEYLSCKPSADGMFLFAKTFLLLSLRQAFENDATLYTLALHYLENLSCMPCKNDPMGAAFKELQQVITSPQETQQTTKKAVEKWISAYRKSSIHH